MPTFTNPTVDAAEAEQALHGLTHATRRIDDPSQIYGILASLSQAVASLSQSLHQLAATHDNHGVGSRTEVVVDPQQAGAAYRVSWDLHRAGEMLKSVQKVVDAAHEAEATLTYQPPAVSRSTGRTSGGVSL